MQFVLKHKGPWTTKVILKKKNRAEGIRFLEFKVYYKIIVIKTVWYWHKNGYMDRKPRGNHINLWSPNLWKGRQEYTMEKRQPLQWVVLGKLDSFTLKSVIRTLPNIIKINLKWIKNLNINLDIIKLLEENSKYTLWYKLQQDLFDPPPRAMKIKM